MVARVALAVALGAPRAHAVPLAPEELLGICAQADNPAHCGRLVEDVQLKRLPTLAVRDGTTLKVSLYPAGTVSFTDTEAVNGGRSYSLWDYFSEINAVVLYVTDGDDALFAVVQRTTGRKTEMPADPRISPDRARLVTADFCERRCANELAVWRVSRDGIHKESWWKPAETWSDAAATWKTSETLAIDYALAGGQARLKFERRLSDPGWLRSSAP